MYFYVSIQKKFVIILATSNCKLLNGCSLNEIGSVIYNEIQITLQSQAE